MAAPALPFALNSLGRVIVRLFFGLACFVGILGHAAEPVEQAGHGFGLALVGDRLAVQVIPRLQQKIVDLLLEQDNGLWRRVGEQGCGHNRSPYLARKPADDSLR